MSAATPGQAADLPVLAAYAAFYAADDAVAADEWAQHTEEFRDRWRRTIAAAQEPHAATASLAGLVDAHFFGDGPHPLQLVCLTENASDVECDTAIALVEPGATWADLDARIVAHAAECHAATQTHAAPGDAPQASLRFALLGKIQEITGCENGDDCARCNQHAADIMADLAREVAPELWTSGPSLVHLNDPEPQSAPELDDTRKRAEAAERELAQLADSLGASVRAARDAERKRIRELADRNGAVCTGDEGTSFYFSALLADKPGGDPDA